VEKAENGDFHPSLLRSLYHDPAIEYDRGIRRGNFEIERLSCISERLSKTNILTGCFSLPLFAYLLWGGLAGWISGCYAWLRVGWVGIWNGHTCMVRAW